MKQAKDRVLIVSGLGFGQESYTNDFGTWNVTRMWADCMAGKHGTPWIVDVGLAYEASKGVEVDEAKVQRFMTLPEVLAIPGICVMEDGMSWYVEGHHRLRAHHRLGLHDIAVFVIEEGDGDQYRVLFNGRRRIEDA
jgi:hypothetical protein